MEVVMARSLMEEMFNQITGSKSTPRKKEKYEKRDRRDNRDREFEKKKYRSERSLFDSKNKAEIYKHRAKSKGWF